MSSNPLVSLLFASLLGAGDFNTERLGILITSQEIDQIGYGWIEASYQKAIVYHLAEHAVTKNGEESNEGFLAFIGSDQNFARTQIPAKFKLGSYMRSEKPDSGKEDSQALLYGISTKSFLEKLRSPQEGLGINIPQNFYFVDSSSSNGETKVLDEIWLKSFSDFKMSDDKFFLLAAQYPPNDPRNSKTQSDVEQKKPPMFLPPEKSFLVRIGSPAVIAKEIEKLYRVGKEEGLCLYGQHFAHVPLKFEITPITPLGEKEESRSEVVRGWFLASSRVHSTGGMLFAPIIQLDELASPNTIRKSLKLPLQYVTKSNDGEISSASISARGFIDTIVKPRVLPTSGGDTQLECRLSSNRGTSACVQIPGGDIQINLNVGNNDSPKEFKVWNPKTGGDYHSVKILVDEAPNYPRIPNIASHIQTRESKFQRK